ncbi:hypothetical protein Tco_0827529, partial [Tanacetum coccineum]
VVGEEEEVDWESMIPPHMDFFSRRLIVMFGMC